ncbi:MAG: RC-LH1 core complex protein PufX, partial [Pseudomonadota bacterium]
MSDQNNNLLNMTETQRLRYDILGLMMKGAGYAALLCIALWAFVYVWVAIGWLLPPESKEAQDPTPLGSVLELVQSLPFA